MHRPAFYRERKPMRIKLNDEERRLVVRAAEQAGMDVAQYMYQAVIKRTHQATGRSTGRSGKPRKAKRATRPEKRARA